MFNINRSYINLQFDAFELLLENIYYVRARYKNDSTLPQVQDYNMDDSYFERYLEAKQDYLRWKESVRRAGPATLVIFICILFIGLGFFFPTPVALTLGLLICLPICLLLWSIYTIKDKRHTKNFNDINAESYIKALKLWIIEHKANDANITL